MSAVRDGWQKICFRDVLLAGVRNGIYKQAEFHGRGTKIVNMGELFGHARMRDIPMRRVEVDQSELTRFGLQTYDLLFARRSLVAEGAGKCSIALDVKEPTVFESSIIRARPDVSKVNPIFLYYLWSSPVGFNLLDSIRRQVAVSGITGKDLEGLEILLPSLPEQNAIASTLNALDEKIEHNEKIAKSLEGLVRAIFRSWFVRFDPVQAKISGATSFPSMQQSVFDSLPMDFEESGVGFLPKGWRFSQIGDVVSLKGGATPSTQNSEYWESGAHYWATPKDMSRLSHPILLDTERRITDSGVDCIGSGLLPVGTVLMSSRAPVGYLAVAGVPTAINQGFIAMVCDGDVPAHYVLEWANSSMDEIKSRASGTTFPEINKKNFRSMKIIVPDKEIILAFRGIAEPIFELISSKIRESSELMRLKNYLLPKLLNGQAGVR